MFELLSSAVLSLLISLGFMPSTPPEQVEALAVTTTTVATHNTLHGSATFKPLADVIGWQEVDTDAGHSKLNALEYYDHYRPGAERLAARNSIAISWRKNKYEKTGDGSRMTHEGDAGVTPARFVNWVVLKNKDTGAKLAFINTHYISGAWNGEHPERQERWRTHNTVVREVVAELLSRGLPVVLVGDFNRQLSQDIPGMNHLRTAGVDGVPIDQIYVSIGIGTGPAERLEKYGSDHFAYSATVQY
ncbi:endonuclease/exonuclease/phosphatase family protein [Hyalangium rubrum]|uniref:Endonuclease/exonuclease/phosphatase family protein n=1 Tax=Hyalangium rubrum TaxID=3103134 RepID=A0ABU5H2D6_9BACT|nr:endonuclease/exonuclease/phosphatase family protein [Hyalangium sp. s54d21]MDY7226948.1 endonuclease/exonuclease/phosphatase family protein [Hyalangium sp. s54d21]